MRAWRRGSSRSITHATDTKAGGAGARHGAPEIASLASEIRARAETARSAPARPAPTTPAPRLLAPTKPSESRERTLEAPTLAPRARRHPSRAALYGIAAFLLAVVIFAATQLRDAPSDTPAAEEEDPSIAVLPLSNLSADPADAVLADGMTEELIAMLAKTGDVRVIASSPCSRSATPDRCAEHSGQPARLERPGGGRAEDWIASARSGPAGGRDGWVDRWSETYDREIEDLFAVQQEIASAVARELGARLGARGDAAPRHTQDVAAYELYLRGNDLSISKRQRSSSGAGVFPAGRRARLDIRRRVRGYVSHVRQAQSDGESGNAGPRPRGSFLASRAEGGGSGRLGCRRPCRARRC